MNSQDCIANIESSRIQNVSGNHLFAMGNPKMIFIKILH